jgi:hypothetical protein
VYVFPIQTVMNILIARGHNLSYFINILTFSYLHKHFQNNNLLLFIFKYFETQSIFAFIKKRWHFFLISFIHNENLFQIYISNMLLNQMFSILITHFHNYKYYYYDDHSFILKTTKIHWSVFFVFGCFQKNSIVKIINYLPMLNQIFIMSFI